MMSLVNILALLIKQDHKRFVFVGKENNNGVKYTHNKSCVIYSSQKDFYTGGKEHPSTSVVGDTVKKI